MSINYSINEIFTSIQGEGYNFGKEVIFLRLTGCNLKCPWCDTKVNDCSMKLTAEEIVKYISEKNMNCNSIIITGGEPTIWDLEPLISLLKKLDFWVGIETNGTTDLDKTSYGNLIDFVACSPKYRFHALPVYLSHVNELRLVVDNSSEEWIKWAYDMNINFFNNSIKLFKYSFISPCFIDTNNAFNLKDLAIAYDILTKKLELRQTRISLQLHKIMDVR